jgi:hypothetical protein
VGDVSFSAVRLDLPKRPADWYIDFDVKLFAQSLVWGGA